MSAPVGDGRGPDEFIEADLAFHRAVFAACQNDLLLYIHDVVSVALGAIRPLHTHSVAHNRETLPTHRAGGQGHPARSPPEGRGGDARDRRGCPADADSGASGDGR